jgi:hypothetical protein
MTVLLIVTAASIVVFGYFLMGRIDRFFGGEKSSRDTASDFVGTGPKNEVLIFDPKAGKAAEAGYPGCDMLPEDLAHCVVTDEPEITGSFHVTALFALSDSDLDNLLLCCKVRHRFPKAYLCAVCNDLAHMGLYRDARVNRILSGSLPPDALMSLIRGEAVQANMKEEREL